MAKLIISNNKDYISKIIEKNTQSGFKTFHKVVACGFELVAFEKKKKPVKNIFVLESGDFVATAGTLFYENDIGEKALKKIYDDFSENVEEMQNRIIGNYLIAIYKQGELYIFTDAYQVLKSYESFNGQSWAIGNGLDDVALINETNEVDYDELAIESLMVSSFGEDTLFKNVKKIMGYQYLKYDGIEVKVLRIEFKKINFDLTSLNENEIAQKYAEMSKKYFNLVSKNFNNSIAIHQTGGLDNRTVLAGFLSVGSKPRLLYGVGNSSLTNTKDEDLEVCRNYEKELNLDLTVMDWSDELNETRSLWQELFNQQGFFYSIYGGARGFVSTYEDKLDNYPAFMECGYFLENLRLREFAEDMPMSISIEEFVDNYLLSDAYGISKNLGLKNFNSIRHKIIKDYKNLIEIYKIDVTKGVTKENFDEVRWIHARHTDSLMVNFLNQYTCSMAIFSQKELHEFPFFVKADYKKYAKFQLKTIESLYSRLLDFRFFSHCQLHRFDKNKFVLINISEKNFIGKLKSFVKLVLPSFVVNKLRALRMKTRKDNTYSNIMNILNEVFINSKDAGKVIELKKIDQSNVVYLVIFAQNVKAIEYLRKIKE